MNSKNETLHETDQETDQERKSTIEWSNNVRSTQ